MLKKSSPIQDKGVLYMRVSTHGQRIEPQRIDLREWALKNDIKILEEIEDVITGKTCSRDGLDRMLEMVRRRQINVVVCVKLDRLGRSLAHLAQVIQEFDSVGCALVATTQGIDTRANSAASRFQLNVLLAVAEFERGLISERTKAGLEAARRRGKTLGRPRCKKLPKNWRQIIAEWRAEGGKGLRGLTRRLGGPSLSTVHNLVRESGGDPS